MNKIKFVSLSKTQSLHESANSFTGEFGGVSFRDCDVVYGPDGTRYVPKDICALVDNAIEILDGLNYGLMSGYLASLPIIYTFSIPTMATDDSHIFINPGFVMELLHMCGNSPIGIAFVITHEVYHVLFKHFERRSNRLAEFPDAKRANMAMDYEINWVIEHAYPMNDDDPTENYDDAGNRIQIFDGITNTCSGLIDPKFKGMIWEDIYDQIDDSNFPEYKEEESTEVVYSKDFQDGFRDGCEKAIRELRAQGLVECSIENVRNCSNILCESSQTVFKGTYDDGFEEGYKRTMNMVKDIINGGQSGKSGTSASNDKAAQNEAPIPNLPDIKLKNPPQLPSGTNQSQNTMNVPHIINMPQQNKEQTQQGQQGGQGQQGQQGGQGQQGQQGGQGQQGQQGGQGQQGQQGGQGQQGQQGGQGQQDGQGNLKIVGVAKGYDGKYKNGGIGNHILSPDDGKILAEEAGYNDGSDSSLYIGKENKFDNVDEIKSTLRKLGQIMDDAAIGKNGVKSASTGNPGSGMMGEIGGIINKIYTPDINWKKELKRYLKGFSYKNEDIGYNKKHITYGRYNRLVDKEGQTAKRLLVCVDTSGSVVYSGDYLRRIVANVADIVTKLGVKYINVIQFADGVYRDTEFRGTTPPPADKFAIKAETGGTNYDKVFDYIDTKYINKHKSFQAVIFFTDMDVTQFVRNSLYNKNKVPKYANKTVWVILDNGSSKQTIGKKLFGKQIFLSPEEFDKRLNFIKDFKNENYNPYCMNRKLLHINEGGNPFKKIKNTNISLNNEPVNNAADNNVGIKKPRRISALAARRMVKFNEITVATNDNYDIDTLQKIDNWLKSNLNDRIRFVYTIHEYYHFKEITKKLIYLDKNSGQLNVVGDLILLGSNSLEFPKYIKFDTVEGNLILGNNYKLESLPAGLPQIVTGNVTIFGMRKLKDLEGSPISVGGTFSVSSCKNLKSLEGAPEKCGYFYSDNFTNDDYQAYLTDAYGVHECLQYKGNNMFLNEAFNSYKLTSLFNNPINKKALDAIKQIKIMWSKIPDTIITPIYNNVARSLQKRRDDNNSGKYGIYIWCDKFDKIYIIATGNNKNNKYDIDCDWSDGRGWLYVDPQLYDIINQRVDLVNFIYNSYKTPNTTPSTGAGIYGYYYNYPGIIANKFNNNVDEVKQYCKKIGVKYDNKNIINTAQKTTCVEFARDLTYYHLLLIPDLCAHAYLIQGTKDPHIPEDYSDANFSYNNSKRQREELQQSRAEMIKNIIVQGRNLNKKDPAYQKYFDEFYLTDEKILEKFTNVKTLFDLRSLIKDEISSVTKMVSITRRNIINVGIKDELIETFDLLTAVFNSMDVKQFIRTAKCTIDIINYALTHLRKDYNDAFLAIIELFMRGFTELNKNNFTSNIFYNNNDIKLRERLARVKSEIKEGNVLSPELHISDCSLAWVVYYTRIVEALSTINSYIDNLKSGKITSDDILKILM